MSDKENTKEDDPKPSPKTIHQALAAFALEFEGLAKDQDNPDYESKYWDLNQINRYAGPLAIKNGFHWSHTITSKDASDGYYILRTTVYLLYFTDVEPSSLVANECSSLLKLHDDMQERGRDQTYTSRYHLNLMLNLREEDDDGKTSKDRVKECENAGPEKNPDAGKVQEVRIAKVQAWLDERVEAYGDAARKVLEEFEVKNASDCLVMTESRKEEFNEAMKSLAAGEESQEGPA